MDFTLDGNAIAQLGNQLLNPESGGQSWVNSREIHGR
jgi:hypothetical protein